MQAGVKVFQALSVKDHPTIINDKKSPDLSNCRIDSPIGALSNMEGTEKYNSVGYGNPIVAIHQLNGHIFSLAGSKLYEGYPFEGYTAITNCVELQAMKDDLTGKYYLANDIDCTYCTQDPNGALYNGGLGFAPIGTFTGIFDGNGHTITGLKINRLFGEVGLFGSINNSEIKNVGMIDANISGDGHYVGGLVGYNNNSTTTNCYSTGAVSGDNDVGGLFGQMGNTVATNCYSTCAVSGDGESIGGLAGSIFSNTTTNCYSTGAVSGSTNVGGFVGYNYLGTYDNCFWDTQTSGQATSAGGTGKTTAQMKQETTFTNWDFTTIWAIVEGVSYPTLR